MHIQSKRIASLLPGEFSALTIIFFALIQIFSLSFQLRGLRQFICELPGYCQSVGGVRMVPCIFETPIDTAAAVATSEEKGIMVEFVPV